MLLVPPSQVDVEARAPGVAAIVPVLTLFGGLCICAGLIGGAWSLVLRLRRSTGVERAQLRWIAAAAAALAASLPLGFGIQGIAAATTSGSRTCR